MSAATVRPVAELRSEHDLLREFQRLMDDEERMLNAHDADGVLVIAEERERLTTALAAAASARRAAGHCDAADEARLIELYRLMRARHEVQSRVVARFNDRNARARGVLAQAAGRADVYGADGRVPMVYSTAA